MTKSCFQIWVSKMTGDYDRYLTQAVEKMKGASDELAEDIKSKYYALDVLPIDEYKAQIYSVRQFT